MQTILSTILLLLILYGVFFIPVGMFNLRMFKEHNGSKATGLQALAAFAPFYSIRFSRKLAYGSSPVFLVLITLSLLLICLRLICVALVQTIPIMVFITAFTTWIAVLLYLVLYIVNAVDFGRMLGGGIVQLLCSIVVPPLGYYMLMNQVAVYFYKEEDELSGRFGH